MADRPFRRRRWMVIVVVLTALIGLTWRVLTPRVDARFVGEWIGGEDWPEQFTAGGSTISGGNSQLVTFNAMSFESPAVPMSRQFKSDGTATVTTRDGEPLKTESQRWWVFGDVLIMQW